MEQNRTTITDAEKAEAIADVFERVHRINTNNEKSQLAITELAECIYASPHYISELLTTPVEVLRFTRSIPNRKPPGSDDLDAEVMKNLSRKAVAQLAYIVNAMF